MYLYIDYNIGIDLHVLFAWHINLPHTSAYHSYISLIVCPLLFPLFQLFVLQYVANRLFSSTLSPGESRAKERLYVSMGVFGTHSHRDSPSYSMTTGLPSTMHLSFTLSLLSFHLLSLLLFNLSSMGDLPQLSALLPDLSWTVCLLSPGRKAQISTKHQWLLFYKQLLSHLSGFF